MVVGEEMQGKEGKTPMNLYAVACVWAEQGCAADAFQRPLRSRFQARLTPGVRLPLINEASNT